MNNYNRLLQYGINKHNITTPTERVELALLYYGGVLASTSNLRIYNQEQDRLENVNFYGMLFMPSGAGKDFAKAIYDDLFSKTTANIPTTIKALATGKLPNGERVTSFPEKYDTKIHRHFSTSIASSDIGLYITALAVQGAKFGSLNIEINEFADYLGKVDNISMLKELYDGKLMAKIIQGNDSDEAREHISGITTNLLAYGSPKSIKENQNKMKVFKDLTSSGMYRRSIIYFEEPMKTSLKEPCVDDVSDIIEYLHKKPLENTIELNRGIKLIGAHNVVVFTPESEQRLKEFAVEMHDLKNSNLDDELLANDTFAHKLIEKIAAIVSYLDCSEQIELSHTEYAIGLFKRTRATIGRLFEQTPVFERIYKTISRSAQPLMQSEIIKRSDLNVKEFADNIGLVNEIAYINDMQLKQTTGSELLKKYSLEPLPYTDLNKIVVSVSAEKDKAQYTTKFVAKYLPMFEGELSIAKLVKTNMLDCFTLAHYEPNKKDKKDMDNGHRAEEFFISGQNAIAFDIDRDVTIEQAIEILKDYKYVIYTTKSHRKEGKGDRFRIIMPTRTMFYVTAEQHKAMYENVSNRLNLPYDIQTRNVSRLWYTNTEAEVIVKEDGDLFDVRCCLPDTNNARRVMLLDGEIDSMNIDIRIKGFYRWFIENTFNGERNGNLYKVATYLKDLGVSDIENHLDKLNSMLEQPLPQSELRNILRSSIK